jgi:hypothetical protein
MKKSGLADSPFFASTPSEPVTARQVSVVEQLAEPEQANTRTGEQANGRTGD